ncbi:hypothetical protein AQUSIP_22260 [Aquicella siphonis]|uniref:Uncharacterized protein n=1 Tax=Aquicella siphonis TaxID=254247 RepID=A0A5E4PIL3_9COXI|nr:hypothetical protein [Aquicella siphonis]VVC76899.1 hypothetical protein AQUSIP_22260 [Aquicella siphonis]
MDTLLPSKPGSYRKIIKTSIKLYRASFTRIILLSLLLSLTMFIPRILTIFIGEDWLFNLPPLSPHRLWILAVDLVVLTFFVGIIWRMHCVIRDKHEPLIEDISVGLKKLLYVVFATLIESAIVFSVMLTMVGIQLVLVKYQVLFYNHLLGGMITLAIFSIQLLLITYISMLFIFLVPLIAIENRGVLGSLERSARLVWNHWWRVFSVQITPWLCYLALLIIIKYVLRINIHIYFVEPSTNTIWTTLIHLIVFALYIPWFAATLLVQLKDLELRKHLVPQ